MSLTEDETNFRLHALVMGRVQGVSFRYFVVEQAAELNINGWVRNRWDGAVEVTAEGKRQKLEKLLELLRQGPPLAVVEDVDFAWQQHTGEYVGFSVRSNA